MGPLTESGKVEKLQKVGRGMVTVIKPSGFVSFIYLEGGKNFLYLQAGGGFANWSKAPN